MPRRKKTSPAEVDNLIREEMAKYAPTVLYVGGDLDQVGWVVDTIGDCLVVTLSDGKTITRHSSNFRAK